MASYSLSSLSLTILNPLLLSAIVIIFPTLVLLYLRILRRRAPNLPPGPPGWPAVGNLFQVVRSGQPFFEYVDSLRKQYGPIFTLRMGTRTLIILSDAKLVHEALVERGPAFASRPRENPTRNIFSANKFTVNAAVYGPVWRSLRRNMVQNMLSSARLREFRSVRERAMDRLVGKLHAESVGDGDGVVSVLKSARFTVIDILVTMCFGVEMEEARLEEIDEVMKTVLITLDPRIDDFLPVLSPFFSKQRRRALQVRKQQLDLVFPLVENRRRALQSPGSDDNATSFSYLDTLFGLRIDGRDTPPTKEELVTLCSEFLNGGTDTTATAIEWGVAELIANPEIQRNLYEEIRSVVGSENRRVEESDVVERMPYLEAFVKELLRKHPPTPFSLTHAVTETTTLGGYDIPADANVDIFFPGILEDPGMWVDPERFDPTRFLGGVGGGNDMRMLSFGVGRRVCPGLSMATVHIHLMVARMVQEFEWSVYPPGTVLDFSGKAEFTVVMKNPLRALIKHRV